MRTEACPEEREMNEQIERAFASSVGDRVDGQLRRAATAMPFSLHCWHKGCCGGFEGCEGVNMILTYGTGSVSDLSIDVSMIARESI